jgi:hypothetical protein
MMLAGMALTAAGAAAQAPQPKPQTPQTPPTRQSPTPQSQRTEQAQSITIEGCLVREADVPGRRPNVAERAGIGEDYVLTSTRMIKGTAPAGGAATTQRPGDQPVGTSGTSTGMYEIDGIDDEQLKPHVGRRVQIDGTFDDLDEARQATDRDDNDDLPEIEASAIRPASGTCPGQ